MSQVSRGANDTSMIRSKVIECVSKGDEEQVNEMCLKKM